MSLKRAGIFTGIGTGFDALKSAGKVAAGTLKAMKVLAHGIAGGVMSVLQGGKFGHGFASAGLTQAFADTIDGIDAGNKGISAKRIVAAAMVGGTSSVLSGGKFASGAVTGAFSRAFNDEHSKKLSSRQNAAVVKAAREAGRAINKMSDKEFLAAFPETISKNSMFDQQEISDEIWIARQELILSLNIIAFDNMGQMVNKMIIDAYVNAPVEAIGGKVFGYAAGTLGVFVEKGWKIFDYGSILNQFMPWESPNAAVACKVGSGCVYFVD